MLIPLMATMYLTKFLLFVPALVVLCEPGLAPRRCLERRRGLRGPILGVLLQTGLTYCVRGMPK